MASDVLRSATKNLDDRALRDALEKVESADLEEVVSDLLDDIERMGVLISERSDPKREKRISTFVEAFEGWLKKSASELVTRLATIRSDALLVQRGYQSILTTLSRTQAQALTAAQHAWAVVRYAHVDLAYVLERLDVGMRERYEKANLFFETGSVHAPMEDGTSIPVDEYTAAVLEVLSGSLLMFGHQNGWFDADGFLVIPSPGAVDDENVRLASGTMALGAAWGQLRIQETNKRFLGGQLTLAQLEEGDRKYDVLQFDNEYGVALSFLAAEQRLRSVMTQHYFQVTNESRYEHLLATGDSAKLPPDQFLDAEEVSTSITLSQLLGFSIVDDTTEYEGLRLVEWIRGYSVFRRLTDSATAKETGSTLHSVAANELLATLTRNGLTPTKASAFLDATRFGRRAVDLYDAPLISCTDGRLYFIPTSLSSTSTVHTVLSQVSRCNQLGKKGPAFERQLLELLKRHEIVAAPIHFREEDEEFECDCAFILDDVLFVCELKNHALPGATAERRYYFLLDMNDAARQVKRIANALAAAPGKVEEALGTSNWSRIEKVVINSMPWSVPTDEGEVAFYDYSAFARLLDSPDLLLKTSAGPQERKLVIATRVRRLWSSSKFSAKDLQREMRDPFQVRAMVPTNTPKQLPAGRIDAVLKAIESAPMKALVTSGDKRKALTAAFEFSERLRLRRNDAAHTTPAYGFADVDEVEEFLVSATRHLPELWSLASV